MPKNTNPRTKVKDLPKPKKELTPKAAKKVKGGLESSLTATTTKVKIGSGGVKGSWDMGGGLPGGLQ